MDRSLLSSLVCNTWGAKWPDTNRVLGYGFIVALFGTGLQTKSGEDRALAFTRNVGKAGGAGGRQALLPGRGVSPQPLFSSAAAGGKRGKTGKLKSPVTVGYQGSSESRTVIL